MNIPREKKSSKEFRKTKEDSSPKEVLKPWEKKGDVPITPQEDTFAKRVKSMYETYCINEFYKKFQSIILDYHKPSLMDMNIINADALGGMNVNEERITKFHVLNHLFTTLSITRFLPSDIFKQIELSPDDPTYDDVVAFWVSTSRLVENKQVLGFPLCIYSNKGLQSVLYGKHKLNLYFLRNPEKNKTSLFSIISDNKNNITIEIFQKTLIFLHLFKNGLISQNYIFEERISRAPIKVTFNVFDILFTMTIKNIIILSPDTKLIPMANVKPSDYFQYFEKEERANIKIEDTFPEFLISNFAEHIGKSYNPRNLNVVMEMSKKISYPEVGKIYVIRKQQTNIICYGIILNRTAYHTTILYFFDSTVPNSPSLSKQTLSTEEVNNLSFGDPNFVTETTNYYIGKK